MNKHSYRNENFSSETSQVHVSNSESNYITWYQQQKMVARENMPWFCNLSFHLVSVILEMILEYEIKYILCPFEVLLYCVNISMCTGKLQLRWMYRLLLWLMIWPFCLFHVMCVCVYKTHTQKPNFSQWVAPWYYSEMSSNVQFLQ